jgi:hypothetical protein
MHEMRFYGRTLWLLPSKHVRLCHQGRVSRWLLPKYLVTSTCAHCMRGLWRQMPTRVLYQSEYQHANLLQGDPVECAVQQAPSFQSEETVAVLQQRRWTSTPVLEAPRKTILREAALDCFSYFFANNWQWDVSSTGCVDLGYVLIMGCLFANHFTFASETRISYEGAMLDTRSLPCVRFTCPKGFCSRKDASVCMPHSAWCVRHTPAQDVTVECT